MRVAIVGGGLAGLTVAYRRVSAGDEVTLYEASERLGGQLSTERSGGFVVEHGAEGFVARSEAVQTLATDLGIAERLVEQLVHRSYRFDGAALIELAPGEAARLLGFQVANDELGRGIRSFASGMADLSDALAQALSGRATVRLACPVLGVEPRSGHAGGASVHLSQGTSEAYDRVVIATGALTAGKLLTSAFGSTASALSATVCTSSTTVTLAYPRSAIAHSLDGTGFISDPSLLGGARAATFVSSKLPGRAPADRAMFRLFFRLSAAELSEANAHFSARAHRALELTLGVQAPPERSWVSRWTEALPVIDDPHRQRIAALEAALGDSRIRLSGSAFHGSGIDAAVRSAERVAGSLGA